MGHKKKVLISLSLSAVLALSIFGTCFYWSPLSCSRSYEAPLLVVFSFSIATFLILLVLYFLREEIFRAWWRFARWYLGILSALFLSMFISGYERSSGMGGPNIGGDLESNIIFFAVLFLLISLGVIIAKYRKPHLVGWRLAVASVIALFLLIIAIILIVLIGGWLFFGE